MEAFVFANINHESIITASNKIKQLWSRWIIYESLKVCGSKYVRSPHLFFNLSIKTVYIPTCLKTAVIKHIFKKGMMTILLITGQFLYQVRTVNYLRRWLAIRWWYDLKSVKSFTGTSTDTDQATAIQLIDKSYKAVDKPD